MEAQLGDLIRLFELFGAGRTLIITFAFFNDHLYLFIIAVVRVLIIIIIARVFHVLASSLALSQHHFIWRAEIDELACCVGCHDFIFALLIAAAELCADRTSGQGVYFDFLDLTAIFVALIVVVLLDNSAAKAAIVDTAQSAVLVRAKRF